MMRNLQAIFVFSLMATVFFTSDLLAEGLRIVGHVRAISGEVSVIAGQSSNGRVKTLKNDMAIYEGDIIKTSHAGRVKIVFLKSSKAESNEIVLTGGTDLVLQRSFNFETKKKGTVLFLKQGSVRSKVKERYSGQGEEVYEVRTPSVVAGVRGTVFQVDYDSKNKQAAVSTLKGKVAVHPRGDLKQSRIVNAGMFVLGQSKALNTPAPIKSDAVMRQRLRNFDKSEKYLNEEAGGPQANLRILPRNTYGIAEELWNENLRKRGLSEEDLEEARLKGAGQESLTQRQNQKGPTTGEADYFRVPVVPSPSNAGASPDANKGAVPARMDRPMIRAPKAARGVNSGGSQRLLPVVGETPHSVGAQDLPLKLKSKSGLE